MKRLKLLPIFLLLFVSLSAHPWKPAHYVIIDTDGGIDDMKALSLLISSPDVRVLGIIASPGALDAETAWKKIKSLMASYYHDGLPVAINRDCSFLSPSFKTAQSAVWGDEKNFDPSKAPDFRVFLNDIFSGEVTGITMICLGGLNTVAGASDAVPLFKSRIKEIIWSAGGEKYEKGFNFGIDSRAAGKVLTTSIPVKMISTEGMADFYDSPFLNRLAAVKNPYAKVITTFQSGTDAQNHPFASTATDELIPLYLHFPQLFSAGSGNKMIYKCTDRQLLQDSYIKIIRGDIVARNQVIRDLPTDPAFYFDDLAPFVNEIIERHGNDEWVSGVISNELHRHLGVFAIIGVKMGIRAREYFCTGVDEFNITSFAGSVPPLSCMNDGLQVSTGATPGHGLLHVKEDPKALPEAIFTYMGRRLKISLKADIAEKISSELKEINFVYGLDSNTYWELVRKNSIKYWLSMDRHDIFNIEELSRQ